MDILLERIDKVASYLTDCNDEIEQLTKEEAESIFIKLVVNMLQIVF